MAKDRSTEWLKVALLGESLNMEQAAALLPDTLRVEWLRLPTCPQRQQLLAARAHVVFFDARRCDLDAMLAFIDAHPATLVIAVNPTDQIATVLSGETYPLASKQDLAQLITVAHGIVRDGPGYDDLRSF